MKPVGLATAAVIVSGIAVAEGWPHAVAAVLLVGVGVRTTSVSRRAREIHETLSSELQGSLARRWAEYSVSLAAAVSGSPAARDLAREALTMLEELSEDGASAGHILMHGIALALRLPGQEARRAQSKVLRVPSRQHSSVPFEDSALSRFFERNGLSDTSTILQLTAVLLIAGVVLLHIGDEGTSGARAAGRADIGRLAIVLLAPVWLSSVIVRLRLAPRKRDDLPPAGR